MTRFLKQRIVYLSLIAALIGAALLYALLRDGLFYQVLFHLRDILENGENLRAAILKQGALAPLLFIALQILQVILAPIPGEASGALGGYIFGGWASTLYSTIGLSIGSWIAFVIGRLLSDLIRTRLEKTKTYHRFNHLVCRGDFVVPFVLFLLPGFPKDSLSYLLGLSHMPLPVFLFVSGVGRIPGTVMLSFQGAEVQAGNYRRLAVLLIVSALVTLPCYLYRKRIVQWLGRYNKRTFPDDNNGDACALPKDE